MEARSIVVADLPPEVDPSEVMATRQLQPLPGSRDPTIVMRRPQLPPPAAKTSGWITILIWVVAGVLAFAFGGVLALLSAKRAASPPPAATTTAAPQR